MMAGFMSYFGTRRDTKQATRDAIVTLRQQLQLIEKKEEYLQKKIDDEYKKAKSNAISNKAVATAALRRKKQSETELDRLSGTRQQLEIQISTLEAANMNAETMHALKKGADALKVIHGNLTMDKVDATMAAVNEQRELANDIAEMIATPINSDPTLDDELAEELLELEQSELNERLMGDHVPVHTPPGVNRVAAEQPRHRTEEEDEEEQLKQLQAELAMV